MTKLKKTAIVAVLAALASGAAGFAGAAEVRISTTGKSTEQVHAEIVKAASNVCWKEVRGEPMATYMYNNCVRHSVNDAVAQLGDTDLVAYNEANQGLVRLASR